MARFRGAATTESGAPAYKEDRTNKISSHGLTRIEHGFGNGFYLCKSVFIRGFSAEPGKSWLSAVSSKINAGLHRGNRCAEDSARYTGACYDLPGRAMRKSSLASGSVRANLLPQMMEPGEALGTAAQVAVALAGFAGVVVVFRTESVHEWSAIDRFRLRLLLGNSMLPLAFCLLGMVFVTVDPPPLGIWRWASACAFVVLVFFGALTGPAARQIPREQFAADLTTRLVFYSLAVVAWLICLLQLYNVIVLHAFWPFFAVIVFQLMAGVIQFVRMILLPHQKS